MAAERAYSLGYSAKLTVKILTDSLRVRVLFVKDRVSYVLLFRYIKYRRRELILDGVHARMNVCVRSNNTHNTSLNLCSGSLKQLCQMRVYEYRDIKYQYRMMSSDNFWLLEISGMNEYCIIFFNRISYQDHSIRCKQLFKMRFLSIWVIQ